LWEHCSNTDYSEADFRVTFRMGRATFAMLCDALRAAATKEDTTLRAAISVHQRVTVCVWHLRLRGNLVCLPSSAGEDFRATPTVWQINLAFI
jgi:hypothetical protein